MEDPTGKRKASVPRHWDEHEDNLLRAAVESYGARHWKLIAKHVPSRSHTQCLQRWNKVLKPGLLKGPWRPDEDEILRRLVEQSLRTLAPLNSHRPKVLTAAISSDSVLTEADPDEFGEGGEALPPLKRIDWNLIAENIPGRSVKQCRERWCSNLDPNIKKGEWSDVEDRILLETQKSQGNCWAHIARLLPGRTEHAVKTRFRSIMRAKKREWAQEEDDLLLRQYAVHGSNWAEIATHFKGARTKNALMTRFKKLQQAGLVPQTLTRRRPRQNRQVTQTQQAVPATLTIPKQEPVFRNPLQTLQAVAPLDTQPQMWQQQQQQLSVSKTLQFQNDRLRTWQSAASVASVGGEAPSLPSLVSQPPPAPFTLSALESSDTSTTATNRLSRIRSYQSSCDSWAGNGDPPIDSKSLLSLLDFDTESCAAQEIQNQPRKRRRLRKYPSSSIVLSSLEAIPFGISNPCQ